MHYNLISEDYLMHHGVKGMKWGVRKRIEAYGYDSASRSTQKRSRNIKDLAKKGAIAAGVIAGGAAAAYMIKSGNAKQLANFGKKFLGSKSSKTFTPDELRSLGISTFEPKTFKVSTFSASKTVSPGPKLNKNVNERILKSRTNDYLNAKRRHGNMVNDYATRVSKEEFKNRANNPQIAEAIKNRDNAKRKLEQVMSPNKTYPTAFPKSSNPTPKKMSSSSVDTGKATATKILKANASTNNTMSWEELAKRNKKLLNKSFNWSDYSLGDLRKMDLY